MVRRHCQLLEHRTGDPLPLPPSLLEGMRAQAQLWEIQSAEGLTSLSWSYLSKVSQWRTTLSETTGDAVNATSKLSAR